MRCPDHNLPTTYGRCERCPRPEHQADHPGPYPNFGCVIVPILDQVDESGSAAGETSPPEAKYPTVTAVATAIERQIGDLMDQLRQADEVNDRLQARVAELEAELARADSAATANLEMARGYQAAVQRVETERGDLERREAHRKPFLDRIARAVGLQDSSLIIDGMAELVEAMAAEQALAEPIAEWADQWFTDDELAGLESPGSGWSERSSKLPDQLRAWRRARDAKAAGAADPRADGSVTQPTHGG